MNNENKSTTNEVVIPHVVGNCYENLQHQKQSNSDAINSKRTEIINSARQIKEMFGIETAHVIIDGITHFVDNAFNQLEESGECIDFQTRKEILDGIYVRSESAKMIIGLLAPFDHIEECQNRIELAEKGVKL